MRKEKEALHVKDTDCTRALKNLRVHEVKRMDCFWLKHSLGRTTGDEIEDEDWRETVKPFCDILWTLDFILQIM